jgi:hypothetical protein
MLMSPRHNTGQNQNMKICMYKGWALSALAPGPTVVYCASPFFDYPFSNPALRM